MSVSPALCLCVAFSPVLHANLCPALPSHCCLLPICITVCSVPFAFFCTMLKPWDQETGILDGSQINLEIAVKHWPEQTRSQLREVLSSCSPPALWCLTHGVNQPSTQMSIKSGFSDCEVSAFGIGEAVHQNLHVVFTPWVM